MTPLNIGLAVAVLVLIALLWKLRHDRAERDADFDDRPIGSWAGPAPAAAPGAGATSGVVQPPAGERTPAGSSWVVGGGGTDAGGWPAGPVTDPGWPHPGHMASAWPAVGGVDPDARQGAGPGLAPAGATTVAAPEWERTSQAGDEDWLTPGSADTTDDPGETIDEVLAMPSTPPMSSAAVAPAVAPAPPAAERAVPPTPAAAEAPAGLPVWDPVPAPPAVATDGAASPQDATPGVDVDPADAWPRWESSVLADAADVADVPPRWQPDAVAAAPTAPPVGDETGAAGPWDDEPVPPLPPGDDAALAVAQQAAAAVDATVAGPSAHLSAYPGLGVAPRDRIDAGRGRFALGGHAMRAGQQAVSGVTFRSPVGVPPSAWAVAPAPGAAPGTLVLHLDGSVNCGVDGLQVVMDAGFAPTEEGFTVRVSAREPGPFIASGTFEITV